MRLKLIEALTFWALCLKSEKKSHFNFFLQYFFIDSVWVETFNQNKNGQPQQMSLSVKLMLKLIDRTLDTPEELAIFVFVCERLRIFYLFIYAF